MGPEFVVVGWRTGRNGERQDSARRRRRRRTRSPCLRGVQWLSAGWEAPHRGRRRGRKERESESESEKRRGEAKAGRLAGRQSVSHSATAYSATQPRPRPRRRQGSSGRLWPTGGHGHIQAATGSYGQLRAAKYGYYSNLTRQTSCQQCQPAQADDEDIHQLSAICHAIRHTPSAICSVPVCRLPSINPRARQAHLLKLLNFFNFFNFSTYFSAQHGRIRPIPLLNPSPHLRRYPPRTRARRSRSLIPERLGRDPAWTAVQSILRPHAGTGTGRRTEVQRGFHHQTSFKDRSTR